MYISLWENSRGHPNNVSFMQYSTKIDGFEQKDSQGFENSYNSYEQYPLEKFFIFTIYQNYTLALIPTLVHVTFSLILFFIWCGCFDFCNKLTMLVEDTFVLLRKCTLIGLNSV